MGDDADIFGDDQPEADGGQVVPFNRAIDRAAEAALTEPGIPGREEFLSMAGMARMIALSPLAPKHLRGEPYSAFLVLLTARDLGISITYAIAKIVPIEGKPSIPPELQRALVRRKGLGDIEPHEDNDTQAVATFARARALYPDGRVGPWATFTWQDAQIAELVDPDCESPLPHVTGDGVQVAGHAVKDCKRKNGDRYKGCYCKDNWRKYPRRMLWQRVQGYVTRDHFPEATLGLYTADELGAITDEDGHVIDVATVELPEGYTDPGEQRAQRSQQATEQAERPSDPADLLELNLRILALPEGLRQQLGARWRADGSDGNEPSRLAQISTTAVPKRLLAMARAMVNAHEAQAKQAGVDLDALRAEVEADTAGVRQLRVKLGLPVDDPEPDPGAAAPAEPDGLPAEPEFDVDAEPASAPEGAPEPEAAPGTPDEALGASSGDQGAPDEGDSTPAEDPPMAEDWNAQLASLAERVRTECQGVPDEVIAEITQEIKGLHHSKLNGQLREAGVPDTGPIDLRRMHLALLHLRVWKAAQQPGPDPLEAPAEQLPDCEHGAAFGECEVPDCTHVAPF
jgi:hypothetical protein